MNTQWNAPAPRSGLGGWLDRLIGPGATPVEVGLQVTSAVVGAIAATTYALTLPTSWTLWQLILIGFLGFDIAGGVATNATSSAKRWYHRSGKSWKDHLAFVAVHLVHIALVALLLRAGDGPFFLSVSLYLLIAASIVVSVPLYVQRPVALMLYGLALVGDRYLISPTPGLEWFLSFFFLKLLIGHLLREMPYQPPKS